MGFCFPPQTGATDTLNTLSFVIAPLPKPRLCLYSRVHPLPPTYSPSSFIWHTKKQIGLSVKEPSTDIHKEGHKEPIDRCQGRFNSGHVLGKNRVPGLLLRRLPAFLRCANLQNKYDPTSKGSILPANLGVELN